MAVTPTLTIRLDADLRAKLEQLATADHRKVTQYVQKVLADHVAATEKKGKK